MRKAVVIVLIISFSVLFVISGFSMLGVYQCHRRGKVLGYKTEWTGFTAARCMLIIDGEKISYERWLENTGR